MRLLILISCFLSFGSHAATETTTLEFDQRTKNSIFSEYAGILIGGVLSFSYDRMINDFLSIRGGYASGGILDNGSWQGMLATGHYLVGSENHKFDLGGGLFGGTTSRDAVVIYPTFSFAYRYQPYSGGLFARVGLATLAGPGGTILPSAAFGFVF